MQRLIAKLLWIFHMSLFTEHHLAFVVTMSNRFFASFHCGRDTTRVVLSLGCRDRVYQGLVFMENCTKMH